jgi:hypothetical protein
MSTVMMLDFVTLEVQLKATPIALQQAILSQLQTHGEPLRWAVTQVDPVRQRVTVEAIVLQSESP